jgi:DNA-binding transcriptional LysR family regulator
MNMRKDLYDLVAFVAVARERSFTRAAAQLGVSQSALSYTIRGLEERLGTRLLTRTTRSVAPTEAGQRLLDHAYPRIEELEQELAALKGESGTPSGLIRLTTAEHAADVIVRPALARFLPAYPGVTVEVSVDYGLIDIVTQRFDAGIRLGEQVAKDMIAVPVGPPMRMAVVATKSYFERMGRPKSPQELPRHNCINLRLPTYGSLYPWEFEKKSREVKVRVDGQLVYNNISQIMLAALDGMGLAWVPADRAAPYLANGQLEQVLADWCAPFPGYHLYYPNRRQASAAFKAFVAALRYPQPDQ